MEGLSAVRHDLERNRLVSMCEDIYPGQYVPHASQFIYESTRDTRALAVVYLPLGMVYLLLGMVYLPVGMVYLQLGMVYLPLGMVW